MSVRNSPRGENSRGGATDPWIWIDFENTPQVLFLEPLIRALRHRGHEVRITVKPQAQTIELARARGLDVTVVGHGNLVGWSRKVALNLQRSASLIRWARQQTGKPVVQLQSSRTASLAARALSIPAIAMLDYEGAIHWPMAVGCRAIWFPDLLRGVRLPLLTRRIARFYPGLKENLYLDGSRFARESTRRTAGVDDDSFLVVARPPAELAHYASNCSWRCWVLALEGLLKRPASQVLVIPRDAEQGARVSAAFRGQGTRVRVESAVVDGPALVQAADLVVGGGGTMNREAAVLGTPAWSTFAGARPWIDECLAREGRLWWVHDEGDLARALAALGTRPTPRGPFAEGFDLILDDVLRYLPARA